VKRSSRRLAGTAALALTGAMLMLAPGALGSGGTSGGGTSGGTTVKADTVKVSKCYTNAGAAGGGEMLIKAASSDPAARLFAYRPDGSLIGELQNGGGSRYGGTVMPYQPFDPVWVTIRSSSGGSITVPTTPFQV
jgi:hypothetical protein